MLTRFAPTPSGFLHRGNAVNALLASWLAGQEGGRLALRIDDADAHRLRPEYVADIFGTLAWLGIDWQVGPRDADDLHRSWSQRLHRDRYWSALDAARSRGADIYACTCSRSSLTGPPSGGCPGGCRQAGLSHEPGRTLLRLHIPLGAAEQVGDSRVDVATALGDIVVWRRDDIPAYHLTSVVDDDDLGVTHIVRGSDLLESTAVQRVLARELGIEAVLRATVLHHGLLAGPDGGKLSKSQLGGTSELVRDAATLAEVHDTARRLGAPLGISPPE